MRASRAGCFAREALIGSGLLLLLGLAWPLAVGTALFLAGAGWFLRTVASWFRRSESRRWFSSLSHLAVSIGALFGACLFTAYYVQGIHDELVDRGLSTFGAEAIVIYIAGTSVAAFFGVFFGQILVVFLGPILSLPYRWVSDGRDRRRKTRKKSKSKKKDGDDPPSGGSGGGGGKLAVAHHAPSAPHAENPGSSLAFE